MAESAQPAETGIAVLLAGGRPGQQVLVRGWVRTRRDSKDVTFIELNDGSCLENLQVVLEPGRPGWEARDDVTTGASLVVSGPLVESPAAGQPVELRPESLEVTGGSEDDFPLQKKRHGFEYLRTIAHLRVRSNTFGALARVRNSLFTQVHGFFQERGFLFLPAPIITASDAEGAGEMFRVTTLDWGRGGEEPDYSRDFFGQKAGLTVSGQLEAEIFAQAFQKVYTFGPTFRAENSNTSRHAAEFWMIEPEMAFAGLEDNLRLAEDFIKAVIGGVLEQCPGDMGFFDARIEKGLLEKLTHVLESPFETITYTEAVRLLEESGEKFEFPAAWGHDLQSEHERYLAEKKLRRPVFVTDYPKDIKAFYMRMNPDGKTVAAMDLLVPGVGEIIGGSQREERLENLRRRMDSMDISPEEYWWYLDLRRYGSTPHSGFGVGFERLLMYITGLGNIRDVIPFPRTPGNIGF
ncbi:MAG: asparagine--tRNA ligase [Deltaproteobacteria bacterium]|nr:asparagine--tRNA ligase [Deltaproteobacteria bacterium]